MSSDNPVAASHVEETEESKALRAEYEAQLEADRAKYLDLVSQIKEAAGESNFISHAERELQYLSKDPDEMQQQINTDIMALLSLFSLQGHSGSSAAYTTSVLTKLLRWEPITPLTGEDSEWVEVGTGVFQNSRCSRVFKDADGGAYDIDGKVFQDKNGSWFTNSESRVPVTFPYVPKTIRVAYVEAEAE